MVAASAGILSTNRGLVAEHLAMAWVSEFAGGSDQFELAVCLGDSASDFLYRMYDDCGGWDKWQGVQVKRVYYKKDARTGKTHPTINLVKNGDVRYREGDFDTVIAVDVKMSTVWVLKAQDVCQYKRLRLGRKWDSSSYTIGSGGQIWLQRSLPAKPALAEPK